MSSIYKRIINKNNDRIMILIHTIEVILISIVVLFRFIAGYTEIGVVALVVSMSLFSIIVLNIMNKSSLEKYEVRYTSHISFVIIYTTIMLEVDNHLVYMFMIPMIIAASLYRDTKYSIITNISYFTIIILVLLIGTINNRFLYIDVHTLLIQITTLSLILITNALVVKIRDDNYLLQLKEIRDSNNKLEYLYNHDKETNLYNRHYLMNNLDELFDKKYLPVAVALINIDALKFINDFYGNKIGDRVINSVGLTIKREIEGKYIGIHMNSDEYMIIMHNKKENEAIEIMERLRDIIGENKVRGINTTVEYGIAVMNNEEATIDSCITLAKNIIYQKKMLNKNSVKSYLLESLKKSLSDSDFETEEHAERTKDMAIKLGKKLGLSDNEQSQLSLLALLHDIGKMSIPQELLVKPSKLTEDEWEIMKTHTNKGYEVANNSIELKSIADYILHHHERWDGTGYPSGLKGENIPLLSRIITVVDSHDVITHNRPYHKALSEEEAKIELKRCSGKQFDPHIVNEFIDMLEEEEKERKERQQKATKRQL